MAAMPAAPEGRKGRGKGKKKAAGGRQGKLELPERSLGAESLGTAELESIVFGAAYRAEKKAAKGGGKGDANVEADASSQARPLMGGPKKKRRKGTQKDADLQENEAPAAPAFPLAAWADPDDAKLEVDISRRGRLKRDDGEKKLNGDEYERRLREHFVKVNGSAKWAQRHTAAAAADDEDSEEEVIPTSAKVIVDGTETLGVGAIKPREVAMSRRTDVVLTSGTNKGPAVIRALQFHPSSELLLTAGFDKRLRFFAVDGEENPKVSSHFFKKFPIQEASFTPDGDQVLLTGETHILGAKVWSLDVRTGVPSGVRPHTARVHDKYFGLTVGPNPMDSPGSKGSRLYSLLADTEVIISDVVTKHPIRTFRMAAPGRAAVFSTTRDTLWTADQECNLYEWDLGSGRCLQKAKESWANGITSLGISREGSYGPKSILAVGTASGNVDFYDASLPKLTKNPYKSMDNLTTAINVVRFHSSGEIMATTSTGKKSGLKLVHTSSGAVYENWPTQKTPLGRVSAVDFSRRSGFMAIGNEQGRVLLYQLTHFERQSAS